MAALPSSERIFASLNLVLVGWALLVVAPRWRHTGNATLGIALAYALLYALLAGEAALDEDQPEGGGFGSLAAVTALFSKPRNVLLGWTHYISYDLLIARGCVLDSLQRGVPWLVMALCLPVLLMLGPLGLVLYAVVASLYPMPVARQEKGS